MQLVAISLDVLAQSGGYLLVLSSRLPAANDARFAGPGFVAAVAFVPPAQQTNLKYQVPAGRAQEKADEASSPFSSVVFGASVGYAAAAVGAAARQGRVTRFAEGDAPAVARMRE